MIRPRFAAAALSAAVLGLTAALVPTASIAEPVAETPAASAEVIWADAAEDFTLFAPDESDFFIENEWQWSAPLVEGSSLGDFATFDANGLNSKDLSPLAVLHGLPAPVLPADLAAETADASVEAGANAQVGLIAQPAAPGEGEFFLETVLAVGGFHGIDTQWSIGGEAPVSTAELAELLAQKNAVVTGYLVVFFGTVPGEGEGEGPGEGQPPVRRDGAQELQLDVQAELFSAPVDASALRAVPGDSGIVSIRFGDLTTYFTPQPAAVLTLERASYTTAQASTTGIPFSAGGFAPGETVTVGLSQGQSGNEVPGVTFVADAEGNVAGTIVLPLDLAVANEFSLVLVGASSAQFASAALAITAGGAPVAVPVPSRASYAG